MRRRRVWGALGIGLFLALAGMTACDSQPDQDELQALFTELGTQSRPVDP